MQIRKLRLEKERILINQMFHLLSPDKKFGYVISWRNEMQIVNAENGRFIRESNTREHNGELGIIKDLALISPDGNRVLAVSVPVSHTGDGELIILNAKTAKQIAYSNTGGLVGHIECASPDLETVMTEGGRRQYHIINGKTGQAQRFLLDPGDGYTSGISADGKRVFIQSWDDELVIKSLETGEIHAKSKTGGKFFYPLEIKVSPDGSTVSAIDTDEIIRLVFDAENAELLKDKASE